MVAGQIAEGDGVVETDERSVTERSEVLLEEGGAMIGRQEDVGEISFPEQMGKILPVVGDLTMNAPVLVKTLFVSAKP